MDRRNVLLNTVAALAAAAFSTITFSKSTMAQDTKSSEHIIEIKGSRFVPNKVTIRPNDTILWINRDIVPHTATAVDKSWDTGRIDQNQSKSIQFTSDMMLAYFCRFHPSMKASIEVVP